MNGNLKAEADASNNITATYIWGGNRLLIKQLADGTQYYYLYNGHGDVVQITDRAGNIVNSYEYDEWGNITSQTETIENEFKYAGQTYDSETGLYYLRARYYDPETGRFISKDSNEGSIVNPLSLNLYTYCVNNPLIYIDPSGHYVVCDWLNNINDKYIGGPANKINENYITPFFDPGDTLGGALESTGKAVGVGIAVKTLIVAPVLGAPTAEKYAQEISAVTKGAGNVAKIGDDVGNLGKLVKNPNVTVNWGSAREHALNRMSKNGVTQDMFESWVKNGKAIQQDSNTYLFLTKEGVAVVSKNGIPQTAYTSAQFKDHIYNAITQVYGK